MSRVHPRFGDHRPANWSPEWMPPPTFGTRRRPERKTYGPAAGKMAAILGTPAMPAQQYIFDVALEVDPTTGCFAYSTVVAKLHRQFGKTMVLVLSKKLAKARLWPNLRMVYTAQDRNHARAKFEEDFVGAIEASGRLKPGRDYDLRLANGSERIKMPNGSIITIAATKSSSGHGKTLDDADVDEAWVHDDTTVDSGFRVPMITRHGVVPGPQVWIVSAAGKEDQSFYFIGLCDRGEKAVQVDSGHGLAYFAWQALPDMDLDDPANWWFFVPGLGHTITEAALAEERDLMDEVDWNRAYASIDEPASVSGGGGLDVDRWEMQLDPGSSITGRCWLGVDGSPGREFASIGACGSRPGGGLHVELIDARPGVSWTFDRVVELVERHDAEVGIDPASSVSYLIPELEAVGVEVRTVNSRQHSQAAVRLMTELDAGSLWHLEQPDLDTAVEAVRTRKLGDSVAWERKNDEDDVTPVVAITMALSAMSHAEPDDEKSVYDELVGADGKMREMS